MSPVLKKLFRKHTILLPEVTAQNHEVSTRIYDSATEILNRVARK